MDMLLKKERKNNLKKKEKLKFIWHFRRKNKVIIQIIDTEDLWQLINYKIL